MVCLSLVGEGVVDRHYLGVLRYVLYNRKGIMKVGVREMRVSAD